MAMENPGALLALFAAVFGPSAAAALSKLARELFPTTALVVCALPDASARVVFSAKVAHNDACLVLHVRGMVSHGELLDQGEDVEVVWKLVFFKFFLILFLCLSSCNVPLGEL